MSTIVAPRSPLSEPELSRPAVAWHVVARTALRIAKEVRDDRRSEALSAQAQMLVKALDSLGIGIVDSRRSGSMSTPCGLTKREIEVLTGMSQGKTNAEIGSHLFVSKDTVKTHARRIFKKLQVNDRAHAAAEGLRRGLIR